MKTSNCQYCNKFFNVGSGSLGKFCSKSCSAKYGNSLRQPKIRIPDSLCLECNGSIFTPNKFCSRSCAAKFNNRLRPAGHCSRITPNSNRGKRSRTEYCKVSWCKICNSIIRNSNRLTCSDQCLTLSLQIGGKKSAIKRCRRSKDEIHLFQLCVSHFRHVRHNEALVNGWDADIIIDDTKTAILWNGPWHYQKMPESFFITSTNPRQN